MNDRSADKLIYERTLRIRSEHVTRDRILRTSSLLRLLQEVSISHTEALGMGRDKTLDKGLLWIIARQHLIVNRMPEYDEEVILRSMPGEMMHVFFPRCYEVLSGADRTSLITGEALWLLMDEKTRTFAFPAEHGIFVPGHPDVPAVSTSGSVRIPENAQLRIRGEYRTRFSQVDINGHVNNANYFDILDDLLEEYFSDAQGDNRRDTADSADQRKKETFSCSGHSLRELRAEYIHEIAPGRHLSIRGYTSPEPAASPASSSDDDRCQDTWYFEGVPSAGKPDFRIMLRLS